MEFTVDFDGDITPFFIAERGDCSFVKKVRNLEAIGVSVAIIIDSQSDDVDTLVMSDDGTGGGIRIPSMIIGKTEGRKLLDFLKRASKEELEQTAIMAQFVMEKPDDRVEYDIWFTSSNDRALDFISDFKEYDQKFGDKVLMQPHYVFWQCPNCEADYIKNDCFANGKYCATEASNDKIKGQDIILEDLREICIYDKYYSESKTRHLWWAYMQYVHQNCYDIINEDCSKRAHERLSLNFQETDQCVKDSFNGRNWTSPNTTNSKIDSEIGYWKTFGAGMYPAVVINNRTYRGQLEDLAVFNALCAGFQTTPSMCQSTLNNYKPDFVASPEDGIRGGVIVGIVTGLILLNVVIVYCYRRYSRREMQSQMHVQIESAVSQYFAMSSNKSYR